MTLTTPPNGIAIQIDRSQPLSIVNMQNVGSGAGVFKSLATNTASFRKINAGANISVTENTDDITIATTSLVAPSRTINTTAPLTGGGDLSADRTIAIPVATSGANGYLASADWTTFNNKVATTRTISTTAPLTGGGDLSANRTIAIPVATDAQDGYLDKDDFSSFNTRLPEDITTNRQSGASYTLVAGDKNKLVEMNNAGANTLTVPTNASVAFSIGTQILIAQYGAGQTTIAAAGGVTINSVGGALNIAARYGGACLIKIATNEWYCFGALS